LAFRRETDPGGFSLIELTIVLAIMGFLGALALPSLTRLAERTQFSLDRQKVERQLDQLPQSAAAHGRTMVLTTTLVPNDGSAAPPVPHDPYPVDLPSGWDIIVDTPIRYRFDGTCSGGTLRLTAPGAEMRYVMNPPLCELRPG
jgi:prepilin-type N-terminal cleavage/methylation domain-containing protein